MYEATIAVMAEAIKRQSSPASDCRSWNACARAAFVAAGVETKDAEIASLRAKDSDVALWMISRGYATGHGDTIADMLGELETQAIERGREKGKKNGT